MKLWFLTALALIMYCGISAAADVAAGKEKSAMCVACHGVAGKAKVPIYPNLAGQHEAYLAQALQAYKNGGRSGGQAEVMKAFVAGLSEEDMNNLAAYYASLAH